MMKSFLTKIPKWVPRGKRWKLEGGANGLILTNAGMGLAMEYGLVLNGETLSYCQPRIRINSPSVVIIPILKTWFGKRIGMLKDIYRPVAEKTLDELPRGFSNKKDDGSFETPLETAIRELSEKDEGGILLPKDRFKCLGGPYNMDDAWLSYPENVGIYIFSCVITKKDLKKINSNLTFIRQKNVKFQYCGISQMAWMTFLCHNKFQFSRRR